MISTEKEADRRTPVSVLTGFLGAGKTTLLNQLLKEPYFNDTAVIINELGSIGVDHHLVDVIDEHTVLLSAGCICCSVQGELVDTLKNLFMRAINKEIKPFKRVIIETTGLAEPSPVLYSLRNDGFLEERYRFDGTLTVVDAQLDLDAISQRPEAAQQIALADVIVLSKTDLVSEVQQAQIAKQLVRMNASAIQMRSHDIAGIARLIGQLNPAQGGNPAQKTMKWLTGQAKPVNPTTGRSLLKPSHRSLSEQHPGISTFVIEFDEPLSPIRFFTCIEAIQIYYGKQVLRFKGLVQFEGKQNLQIIQGVHGQLYPVGTLERQIDSDIYSCLVFIVDQVDHQDIEEDIRNILFNQAIRSA
ncbi:CobW family GTP-binding protein [Iodobacter arcticus]|uniref:CobW family GTP-binding protein n=1 Tax=Iodobacter arcticus TaxID=590593 RepID=A0ABW2R1C0_9NEIS